MFLLPSVIHTFQFFFILPRNGSVLSTLCLCLLSYAKLLSLQLKKVSGLYAKFSEPIRIKLKCFTTELTRLVSSPVEHRELVYSQTTLTAIKLKTPFIKIKIKKLTRGRRKRDATVEGTFESLLKKEVCRINKKLPI